MACRVRPSHAKRHGETMDLMFDMSKTVFFDPQTGVLLLRALLETASGVTTTSSSAGRLASARRIAVGRS